MSSLKGQVLACRYDRSLWPAELAANSTAMSQGTRSTSKFDSEQQGLQRSALQSVKHRMAAVLDVELCNAA